MARNKIGISSTVFARNKAATATNGTAATGTTTAAKPDLTGFTFANIDVGSDPLLVQVNVPAYTVGSVNNLTSMTAIAVGFGSGKPSNADGYLASALPKTTILAAPAATAQPGTAAPNVGTVAAPTATAPTPASAVAVGIAPAAQATATAPAAAVNATAPNGAAAATTPASPAAPAIEASAYLPGPSGGVVSFLIPNVPNGKFEIVMVETYDI